MTLLDRSAAEVRPSPPGLGMLARAGTSYGLRSLHPRQLAGLAAQIRTLLVSSVSATGGHLGASLGTVELAIALHRVFDSPRDAIVFDTGHQAYPHKVLTGRAGQLATLRRAGGLSGYPNRAESEHDWVENSHASTALAYADGLAKAFQAGGRTHRRVIAVVGDGAMTGGPALEALNNIGAAPERPVIVVLNDNARSYDPTVGALAAHLALLRRGGRRARRRNVFTDLGLAYLGPIDGHDIAALEAALRKAAALQRPVVVHAVTAKGRGYPPAEADTDDRMHACGVIDPTTGRPLKAQAATWTGVFAEEIAELGEVRPNLVALTAAMRLPVGLGPFSARFPDRVFDSGIAEAHALTSAAGLAMGGMHPVVCLYSTFLNRAFDQVLLDVALHRLPVTLVLDRAGITGPDGPSHHGMWDTALLALVPGLRLAAPRDPARLRELLREAVGHEGPTAIRFPKAAAGPDIDAVARIEGVDILHRSDQSSDVLLVAAGTMAEPCLAAAARLEGFGIGVTLADPRWIIPVNPALTDLAARHRLVVTVEDAARTGGMGTAVQTACSDADVTAPIRALALPRRFIDHGERADLLKAAGLSAEGVTRAVLDAFDTLRPAATASQDPPGPRHAPDPTARSADSPQPPALAPARRTP